MKHVYLPIITTSPLTIRSDHAQDGAETTDAIPGATLLGGLAAAHRILHPEREDQFTAFFLNEQISVPYLYPATFNKRASDFNESAAPIIPLPKTARSCKRFPGFRPLAYEDPDEKRHGVRDSLLDWAVFQLLGKEPQSSILSLLEVFDPHKKCTCIVQSAECQQPMEREPGYYRCHEDKPELRMKATARKHLQTRTGINRNWGTVAEGILYNREVFDEGMRFWGELVLPEDEKLADTFMRFVEEASEEDVIRIGTGRTRGLGGIQVAGKLSVSRQEDLAAFKQRLEQFHKHLTRQAEAAGVQALEPFYFAVTLRSPTILYDAFLRYRTALDSTTLAEGLHLPSDTYSFPKIYQATETQRITGWNELWGTPRPNDYALEMGSTFLFSCTSALDDALLHALYTLEETGLGQRRAEGFGRICISDRFHLQGEQA